uniref:Gustatory receptor n=1 Tax=Anopheles maculatus TaxID=74869 RepID=A0A182SUQ9_9DIPT
MQVLNIFHALFISNVRTVRRKDRTVGYKISRPRLQLLLPLVTILTLAFLNPWVTGHKQCTNCVNWFTIISRLLATLVVAILLVFDNFRQRHKVLALLQTIPSAGSVAIRASGRYTVKRLQLSILLLCNILSVVELLYNVYRNHVYLYIWGVFTGVIIEHYILLTSLLCQLLAETIANTYDALQQALPVCPSASIINEMVILDRCKDQLSDAIGLKLLLVMMHLLFNVSFCTYDILQKVVSQAHMQNIARLTIIAVQEIVMLFGLCFYYSMLTLKVGYGLLPTHTLSKLGRISTYK